MSRYLTKDATILVVANDRFNLYPEIARQSGLIIHDKFQRAVTKRTEKGNDPYQEVIFLLRRSNNDAIA